ncbi:hypothetical protein TWF694_001550 [Orbilia ellipsospora]|uniref:Wax synthase domain-containing protein n=1 Tax=Orbilia ellipsospora TaxID=2528407 RepID=A0AAV9XRW0_9PEZI
MMFTFDPLQAAFVGVPILTLIILSLPSSSVIRLGLYPLPAILLFRAFRWPPTGTRDADESYLYGLFATVFLLRFSDYLYIQGYDAPKHFYRLKSKTGRSDALERLEYPRNLGGRVHWALLLIFSQRGIGWNIQVPLPRTKYLVDRRAFVRQSVFLLLEIYLGLYLVGQSCQYMVRVLRDEVPTKPYPWIREIFSNEMFQILVGLIGWIISIISHVSVPYNQVALICVGLGIGGTWSKIESWPSTFGRLKGIWSIRRVWGKVWHQNNRRCLNAPGEKVASILLDEPSRLSRPLRLLRRYFLLFSAFASSGLLHALGVYFVTVTQPMIYSDSTPPHERPSWHATAYFFYLQAVAITIEDFFCWAFGISDESDIKIPSARWVVGVFYTMLWFFFTTIPFWVHPQLAASGYQRISDQGKGYIHVLEATGKASSVMPLNPWPAIVEGVSLLFNKAM